MPPDPPPLTRTKRLYPHSSQTDASNAYEDVMQMDSDANPTGAGMARERPSQRLESMDINQLWDRLLTDKQENRDVIVPANLVPIMSALLLSMKETTIRMNAMEAQLKVSSAATQQLDNLERQMREFMKAQTATNPPSPPTNSLPEKPMSWAKTAMSGLKVTSSKAPLAPPPNHVINVFRPSNVIIRTVEGKKPFDGIKPTEIVNRINEALAWLEVKVAGQGLEVKGAASLPSGSIKLFTTTRAEADWLLENRVTWSTEADPDFVTSPAVFPVVIDSVPMNEETYPDTDNIATVITEKDPIQMKEIHLIRWLSKPYTGQTSGSILVNLLDKELMHKMIRGSVYFEGNSLRVRACKKNRVQWFRCQEPGHISLQCKSDFLCKNCGSSHDSRTCPIPEKEHPQCFRCINHDVQLNPDTPVDKKNEKYAHSVSSANCPIRSRSLPKSSHQSC